VGGEGFLSFFIGIASLSLNFCFMTSNAAAACANFACPDEAKLILNIATATAVPEPASIAILGAGLAGLAALRRRRQR
jgi:hypothetical protein